MPMQDDGECDRFRDDLHLRRRRYAFRGRVGLEGYRAGSWQHLAYRLLGPPRRSPFRPGEWLAIIVPAMVAVWAVAVIVGPPQADGRTVALILAAVWFVAGVVQFVIDLAEVRPFGPSLWPPPDAGDREPRDPTPGLDDGAIGLDISQDSREGR